MFPVTSHLCQCLRWYWFYHLVNDLKELGEKGKSQKSVVLIFKIMKQKIVFPKLLMLGGLKYILSKSMHFGLQTYISYILSFTVTFALIHT